MLATLVAAGLLCALSLLIGQALCILGRGAPAWYGGAIGLAAVLVVSRVAIRLPGDATTAAVVVALLALAAAVLLVRHAGSWRRAASWVPAEGVGIVALTLLGACLPFLANERAGLLGVSFNNDTSQHLLWAERLRDTLGGTLAPSPGSYPLGPHAVMAALAQATGFDMDVALTALLITLPILTALAARTVLDDVPALGRIVVPALAGLAYLAASYYAQGAFKETIAAGLILTFAVVLHDVERTGVAVRRAALLAFPVAGVLYSFSYPGAAWPALTIGLWLVADLALRAWGSGWRGVRAQLRALVPAVGVAIAVLAVLIAVELPSLIDFYRAALGTGAVTAGGIASTNLGNLVGPLKLYQAFGVWLAPDFRVAPPNGAFNTGVFAGLAAAAAAYGVVSLLTRRRLALPAALGAAAIIYLRSRGVGDSPYVTAKALVIAAPLVVVAVGAGLWRRMPGLSWHSELNVARWLLLGVFLVTAGLSSFYALRGAQVDPSAHRDELADVQPLLRGAPTLFLSNDDYYAWELRDTRVAQPAIAAPIPVALRPAKGWEYGQPFDFDSVDAATLDRFSFVITSRTADQSEAPANFRVVRQTRSFTVWRRSGPTVPRETVPTEHGTPGGVLDCSTPAGRQLSRRSGVARVMPEPVGNSGPPGPLLPGHSLTLPFRLPPGHWTLSAPYVGPQDVTVRVGSLRATLPANLDRPGPLWQLGELDVAPGEHLTLTVSIASAAFWPLRSTTHLAYLGNVIATRADVARETVPLSQACGRYVDWYRLAT